MSTSAIESAGGDILSNLDVSYETIQEDVVRPMSVKVTGELELTFESGRLSAITLVPFWDRGAGRYAKYTLDESGTEITAVETNGVEGKEDDFTITAEGREEDDYFIPEKLTLESGQNLYPIEELTFRENGTLERVIRREKDELKAVEVVVAEDGRTPTHLNGYSPSRRAEGVIRFIEHRYKREETGEYPELQDKHTYQFSPKVAEQVLTDRTKLGDYRDYVAFYGEGEYDREVQLSVGYENGSVARIYSLQDDRFKTKDTIGLYQFDFTNAASGKVMIQTTEAPVAGREIKNREEVSVKQALQVVVNTIGLERAKTIPGLETAFREFDEPDAGKVSGVPPRP